MAAFIAQNMAPIMFASLVVFLLLGYPVAFSLGACGLLFFIVGVELAPLSKGAINLSWPLLQSLPERIYGVMSNDTLLAIPFFTLMGLVLERSGMAEDLLDTIGQLFGTVKGGLAYAVIFVGALLAATTGVVAASVISMGLISLPIMLRYGYDRRVASGVIAASGTLAQIIPPSLVLIVMADQLGKSVGDMYEGAFVPGVVLAGLYAFYIWLITTLYPASGPGLPEEALLYKEPSPRLRDVLSRGSSLLLLPLCAIAVYFVGTDLYASVLGKAATFDVLSLILIVIKLAALAVLLLGLVRLPGTIANGGDERGLTSLLLLAVISGTIGVFVMNTTRYKGAEFVILCMGVAIVVAFSAAIVNWVLNKVTGVRFLSLMAQQVTFVMVPPLFLIFLVLGTIFIGVATPTEGGAMGATGSILLAMFKRWLDNDPRRFNYALLRSAVEATAKLSAFVVFILVGARIFSLSFYGVNGHIWVEHLLTSLPGGQTGFLIFVNIMVFLLAFFLDFFELAFIVIPLLGPAAEKLGIDLIWFGVILGVNMQTSFMHPPFGFALFYLRSVAPKEPFNDKVTGKLTDPVTTGQIYWGAVPFVIIQCIMVGLVIGFPQMVMHYKSTGPVIDPSKVEIKIPTFPGMPGAPGAPGGLNLPPPNFGAPGGLSLPPFGAPAPAVPAPAVPAVPAAPAAVPTPAPASTTPAQAPAAPAAAPTMPALPPPSGMIDITKPPASLKELAPKPQ
jgi:TRAP-type mannitol/chloroaromatic compound transport system permease large subunit